MPRPRLKTGDIILQSFDIRIIEKIAEGGMGEVYEAVLHGTSGFEKRIALKVIRAALAGIDQPDPSVTEAARRQDFIERFVDEAKLVSDLIHIHIVQIYLLGETNDGDGFIAMELVNGINLRSFMDKHIMEEKMIPIEIAVYIVSRIARALEYAHNAVDRERNLLGIVHRDVSPTNLLISVEGVVKLTDFGIAKAVRRERQAEEYLAGKRRYMAPEQMAMSSLDFRADIFSLGLILTELLTLRAPEREFAIDRPTTFRSEIPSAIEDIIRTATHRNPEDRYGSTTEMALALEHAIYDQGYGPTFVTMAAYLRDIFPGLLIDLPGATPEDRTVLLRK